MPTSYLVWNTAGFPLPKQPPEVDEGREEGDERPRADTGCSVAWRRRLSFLVRVQGSVDVLDVGKAAASLQEPSSITSFLTLWLALLPTLSPSSRLPAWEPLCQLQPPLGLAWLSLWPLGFNLAQESLEREEVKAERGLLPWKRGQSQKEGLGQEPQRTGERVERPLAGHSRASLGPLESVPQTEGDPQPRGADIS